MAYTYEDKIAFAKNLYCPARQLADECGCSWELLMAQAIHETGWGEKILPGTNNIYNIKADASWKGASKVFHVWEESKKGSYWVDDPFRIYPSIFDSLRDRQKFLMENPRYARVFAPGVKGNFDEELKELAKAGFGTDLRYVHKVQQIVVGRTYKKAIAAAQKEGCKGCLPTLNIYVLDGARVKLDGAKVKASQGGKTLELVADKEGHVQIQAALSNGKVTIEVWSEHDKKWVPAEQDAKPSTPPTALTFISPTFVVQTSTDHHEPVAAATGASAPTATTAAASSAGAGASKTPASASHAQGAHHPATTTYKVKKGDSLIKIAKAHSTSYLTIARLNGISSPYYLHPGQELKMPKPAHHDSTPAAHADNAQQHTAQPSPAASQPATPQAASQSPAASQPQAASQSAAQPAPSTMPQSTPQAGAQPGTGASASSSQSASASQPTTASSTLQPESAVHAVRYRSESDHPQTDVLSAHRAPWMAFAEEELRRGVRRRARTAPADPRIVEYFTATSVRSQNTGQLAYCAAFVNWCLSRAGFRGNSSAVAATLASWGRATRDNKPAYGAVAVVRFPDGQHHVTFVNGRSPSPPGRILIATLGGNQGQAHEVNYSHVPQSWITHCRFPVGYVESDDDYHLALIDAHSTQMSSASTR